MKWAPIELGFVTSDLECLHGGSLLLSLLFLSFPLNWIAAVNPLTGKEKIHFFLLLGW